MIDIKYVRELLLKVTKYSQEDDDEMAHVIEKELLLYVAECATKSSDTVLREAANIALRGLDIEFSRWFA